MRLYYLWAQMQNTTELFSWYIRVSSNNQPIYKDKSVLFLYYSEPGISFFLKFPKAIAHEARRNGSWIGVY